MVNHSFAVMAFHDSPYLAGCLESLKKQTVESRIYVVTSTPSPFISKTAASFQAEVYATDANLGIAHDWNAGLQHATTKYVTLAHQDDLYLPEFAETCIGRAEQFTDTLICFTGYTEIAGGNERSGTLLLRIKKLICGIFMPVKKNIRSRFWKTRFLSFGCPLAAPGVMYNLERLGNFQFSPGYMTNLDWDAWYRMAKMDGRFVYEKSPLFKHRIHAHSATTTGLKMNARQSEDLELFRRFWPTPVANMLAGLYAGSYRSNRDG